MSAGGEREQETAGRGRARSAAGARGRRGARALPNSDKDGLVSEERVERAALAASDRVVPSSAIGRRRARPRDRPPRRSRAAARRSARCGRRPTSRRCASTVASVRVSTAESGSSSTSTRASEISARASATRWRWPPERLTPRSPISVSKPSGSWSRNASTPAASQAASTSSHGASVRPASRFSRSGAENSTGRCVPTATAARSRRAQVAHVDAADLDAARSGRRSARRGRAGSTCRRPCRRRPRRSRPGRARGRPRAAPRARSRRRSRPPRRTASGPAGSVAARRLGAAAISSSHAKLRPADAMARWPRLTIQPSASSGQASCRSSVLKSANCPSVRSPLITRWPPSAITAAIARVGTNSSSGR